jgi:hypothetical protein
MLQGVQELEAGMDECTNILVHPHFHDLFALFFYGLLSSWIEGLTFRSSYCAKSWEC